MEQINNRVLLFQDPRVKANECPFFVFLGS